MKKEIRNAVVATAVALGGVAVLAKKLSADPELKETAKQKGKQTWDDAKEFGKSVKDVAVDVSSNISKEASVIKDKAVNDATELKDKVKAEVDSIKAEVKEKMQEEEQKKTNGQETSENVEQAKVDSKSEEKIPEQVNPIKGMAAMFREAQRDALRKLDEATEHEDNKTWTSYNKEQKDANEAEKAKQLDDELSRKFWDGANKVHDFIFGKKGN